MSKYYRMHYGRDDLVTTLSLACFIYNNRLDRNVFFLHNEVANRYIVTGTKFAKRSPCKLVQLLMTHSAEAFDSEQNVACTSSRRIIKLGNKPKNLRLSPARGRRITPTQKFHSAKISFVAPPSIGVLR